MHLVNTLNRRHPAGRITLTKGRQQLAAEQHDGSGLVSEVPTLPRPSFSKPSWCKTGFSQPGAGTSLANQTPTRKPARSCANNDWSDGLVGCRARRWDSA